MKLHYITRNKIATALVGEGETREFAPYRTWKTMKEFFYMLDILELNTDNTSIDIGSRVKYASAVLQMLEREDGNKIATVINEMFNDIYFVIDGYDKQKLADYMNIYLIKDGYEIKQNSTGAYKIYNAKAEIINEVVLPFSASDEINQAFIIKQVEEGKKRIEEKNYWGQ